MKLVDRLTALALVLATAPGAISLGAADESALKPVVAASRASGVAPLAVFFDATATTAGGISNPFHDLRFDWDFGDPGSGDWKPAGQSRNAASGAVAAHVFESPGSYTVRLTIRDASGGSATEQVKIAVDDPDKFFSGPMTICVSSKGDFTGAPAGSKRLAARTLEDVMSFAATGKRLLLRRGEEWRTGARWPINVPGPGMIGAFGPGERPRIVLAGNQSLFELSGKRPLLQDWRFVDLEIDGGDGPKTAGVSAEGSIRQALFLRLSVRNVHRGIAIGSGAVEYYHQRGEPGQFLHDQIAIVDSDVRRIIGGKGGNGSMLAAERLMFLGNRYEDSSGAEHVVRAQYIRKGVMSHNDLGLPAMRKHVLKLHALPFHGGGLAEGRYTEQVIVSRNTLRGGIGDWIFVPGPEDGHTDQRVRDIIIEGNHIIAGRTSSVGLFVCGSSMTIRNNLFDMSAAEKSTCVIVNRRGVEPPPADIRLLNNTGFSSAAGSFAFLSVGEVASRTSAHNNLAAAPASRQAKMLSGAAPGITEACNLLTATPGFVAPQPSKWEDFRLGKGSPGLGAGKALDAVWDDFTGAPRPPRAAAAAPSDLGALQGVEAAVPAPPGQPPRPAGG